MTNPIYGMQIVNGKIVEHPTEQQVIDIVKNGYTELRNLRHITAELNQAGFRTRRGKLWTVASVSHLAFRLGFQRQRNAAVRVEINAIVKRMYLAGEKLDAIAAELNRQKFKTRYGTQWTGGAISPLARRLVPRGQIRPVGANKKVVAPCRDDSHVPVLRSTKNILIRDPHATIIYALRIAEPVHWPAICNTLTNLLPLEYLGYDSAVNALAAYDNVYERRQEERISLLDATIQFELSLLDARIQLELSMERRD